MPVLVSEDGRWWWDGRQWLSRSVDGELSLFWFTSTPEWAARVLVTGAIALIPIVGPINAYGWTLAAADMVRSNWRELPPAGFGHLERGVRFFVVGLVYGFVVLAFVIGVAVVAVVIGLTGSWRVPLAFAVGAFLFLVLLGLWALNLYVLGPLLIGSDRLGIAAALNPFRILAIARANHPACLRIAVTYSVASICLAVVLGTIGFFIPFVGLLAAFAVPVIFAILVPQLAKIEVGVPAAG